MATIASLNIDLRSNTAKFTEGMRRAQKGTMSFSDRIAKTAAKLVIFSEAFNRIKQVGRQFFEFTRAQFATIDALGKTADKLGIATEELAALRLGAKLSGIETRTLDMGLQRFIRRLGEASKDTGEAQAALKELGIDAKALAGDPMEAFRQVADAIAGTESSTDRLRLAFKLFDSEGVALVNLLRGGSEGLKEFAEESRRAGTDLSRIDVRGVEQFNDAMTKIRQNFTGIAQQLAVSLAPVLEGIVNTFREMQVDAKFFADTLIGGFAEIGAAAIRVAKSIEVLRVILKTGQATTNEFLAWLLEDPNAIRFSEDQKRFEKMWAEELRRSADGIWEGLITDRGLDEQIDQWVAKFKSNIDAAREDAIRFNSQLGSGLDVPEVPGMGGQRLTPAALQRGTSAAFSAANRGGGGPLLRVANAAEATDKKMAELIREQRAVKAVLERGLLADAGEFLPL